MIVKRLEELRAEIARLNQAIVAIQSDTLPGDEIAAAVQQFLDDASDDPLYRYQELAQPGGLRTAVAADGTWLLLGLFRAEVEKRLTKYLCDTNPGCGLPAAERAAKAAELQAQRRGAEIEEELEVLRLEDSGQEVSRRTDVDGTLVADVWAEQLSDDGRLKVDEAA